MSTNALAPFSSSLIAAANALFLLWWSNNSGHKVIALLVLLASQLEEMMKVSKMGTKMLAMSLPSACPCAATGLCLAVLA